ncbi:MAG: hypothetical protein H0V62_12865 [Gammaproteobacteria bacterium]|nr:hypothetical protein [Gammaproteobacteria bacterium]
MPELENHRARVARIFEDTLHPRAASPQVTGESRAFNISLGAPLRDYPMNMV